LSLVDEKLSFLFFGEVGNGKINFIFSCSSFSHLLHEEQFPQNSCFIDSQFNNCANFIAIASLPAPCGPEKIYALATLSEIAIFIIFCQTSLCAEVIDPYIIS
tara:strand:- start:622 stop:930 length:309 start_codon:yes stop_codon:yes gene_type:complete